MFLKSPRLSLSRKQTPDVSMSWRTSSSVGWSPQTLTSGMDRSSRKKVIFLPPGGPKFLPPCLSSSASMACWNMPGVVADEKFIFFRSMWSALNVSKNVSAFDVFAVPDPPTSSTGWCISCMYFMSAVDRHVSIVGTSTELQSSTSPRGALKVAGLQRSHSMVSMLTAYSKMVSPSATSRGAFADAAGPSRSHASHFARSSASSRPAMPQVMAKSTRRSSSPSASSCDSESSACFKSADRSTSVFSTEPTRVTASGWPQEPRRNSKAMPGSRSDLQLPRYLAKWPRSMSPWACLPSQAWSTGSQSRSDADTKMMPARLTVAGDAFLRSSTSNMSLTVSAMGMRSPLASVRILLSSRTVFRFSIQTASTGPSQMIHVLSLRLRSLNLDQMDAKMPLSHSPLRRSVSPNISSARMALGFMRTRLFCIPVVAVSASWSTLMIVDLPDPGGPTIMMPWRTSVVS